MLAARDAFKAKHVLQFSLPPREPAVLGCRRHCQERVTGRQVIGEHPAHGFPCPALAQQILAGTDEIRPQVPVELVMAPKLDREMKKYRNDDFEFTARDVSFFDKVDEQWDPEQRGALVESVKSGSWAELGSLAEGDLILEVNGQPIDSVEALRREMEKIAKARDKTVVIKVLRGIHTSYLQIEPNWKG